MLRDDASYRGVVPDTRIENEALHPVHFFSALKAALQSQGPQKGPLQAHVPFMNGPLMAQSLCGP